MKSAEKNDEANEILLDIKKIDETLDNAELICTKTDRTKYDFNIFVLPLKFVERIYNYKITLDEVKEDQDKLEKLIIRLENYSAKKEEKKKVLESAVKLFNARRDLIVFIKKEFFRLKVMYLKQKKKNQKKNQKKQ